MQKIPIDLSLNQMYRSRKATMGLITGMKRHSMAYLEIMQK